MWRVTQMHTLDLYQTHGLARMPRAAACGIGAWPESGPLQQPARPKRLHHAPGHLLRLRPRSSARSSGSCYSVTDVPRRLQLAALPGLLAVRHRLCLQATSSSDNSSTQGGSSIASVQSDNGAGAVNASNSSDSSSHLAASPGPGSMHHPAGSFSGAVSSGGEASHAAAEAAVQPSQDAATGPPSALAHQHQAVDTISASTPGARTAATAAAPAERLAGDRPGHAAQSEEGRPPMPAPAAPPRKGRLYFIGSIAAVVISGVANRVLYKMAITPLSNYVFFMAQLQTFGYCFVYFGILALRYRAGKVQREQLGTPLQYRRLFTKIGLVEAVSSLLGFLGAANLPGVVLPLLSQTVMFWQVLLAKFMLRKALGRTQLVGVGLVVAGVVLAAWPSAGGGSPLANVHPGYAWLFVFSMLFPALDTIYKERLFREVREKSGRDLDLFVVNSYGSLSQAAFVFALLPIMTTVKGLTLADMPGYAARGFQCLRGLTPSCGSDCTGAPLLPLAYVATNLVFNIAALSLIRTAGNVTMSLVMSAMVPVTIWAFTIDLPFLPPAPPLGPTFLAGTAVLLLGLLAYNAPLWLPAIRKRLQRWLEEGSGSGGVTSVVAG